MTSPREYIIRISAPPPRGFTAGVDVRWHGAAARVVYAAPILKYMMGWHPDRVARYCEKKGWTCETIKDETAK